MWDYAREGNVRKLKMSIDSGRYSAEQQTHWLKNTPLHIAVRSLQLEIVKSLLYDYQVDVSVKNSLEKSALDVAQ